MTVIKMEEEYLYLLRDELVNLKSILNNIERETRYDILNRSECKFFLNKLIPNLISIRDIFIFDIAKKSIEDEEYSKFLNHAFELYFNTKAPIYEKMSGWKTINDLNADIKSFTRNMDAMNRKKESYSSSDSYVKDKINSFINIFEIFVERIVFAFLKPSNIEIVEEISIQQFLQENKLNLDENWMIAVSYLSAIDILVNRKREEFGLVKDENREMRLPFFQKFDELVAKVKAKGISINDGMLGFQKILRDFRTQVIHKGFNPLKKELDLIIEWSHKTIAELFRFNLKNIN